MLIQHTEQRLNVENLQFGETGGVREGQGEVTWGHKVFLDRSGMTSL